MSETKLATVRFGIRPDVIDDTEIQNLIESYHREYITITPDDLSSQCDTKSLNN